MASDFIGNRKNHRYLALVSDAYSKKIVGYDLSPAWVPMVQ